MASEAGAGGNIIVMVIDAPADEKKTLVRELAGFFRMNQSVVQHFPRGWPNGCPMRDTIDAAKAQGIHLLIVEVPEDSLG